jgi:F-type H+-transporting ATPase subunit delta
MSVFSARYARAFTDVIFSAKLSFPEVDRQLSDFAATWHGSSELRELLSNPAFPAEQKVAFLDTLNERMGLAPQVRNFIAVMINHDRLSALDEVLADFRREMNASLGISEVEVVTARKLDEVERRQLEEQVGRLAGTRVQAKFEEDSSLLGGAVVRIGSTVYDGSVRGRLQRLKEQLVAG